MGTAPRRFFLGAGKEDEHWRIEIAPAEGGID
jgi:hypothetical protein